jgi:uncharacterized membrane protein YhdT
LEPSGPDGVLHLRQRGEIIEKIALSLLLTVVFAVTAYSQMGAGQGGGMMGGNLGWEMGYGWGFGIIIAMSRALLIVFALVIGFVSGWIVHSYLAPLRSKERSVDST